MRECLLLDRGDCRGEVVLYYEGTTNDGEEVSVSLCDKHYYTFFDLREPEVRDVADL